MLLRSVDSPCGLERPIPQLLWIPVQDHVDSCRAGGGIEASIRFAAARVHALKGATDVGHDDRQPARDGLGNTEAERLVRTGVHEDVRAGERSGEARSILLEPGKMDPFRSHSLEPLPLGAISVEHQNGLSARAHLRERLDDDVPALLEGESADSDQDGHPFARPREPSAAPGFAATGWMEDGRVHAEGRENDRAHPGGAQTIGLRPARDEYGVEWGENRRRERPERTAHHASQPVSEACLHRRLDVRAHVVGVPKRGGDLRTPVAGR